MAQSLKAVTSARVSGLRGRMVVPLAVLATVGIPLGGMQLVEAWGSESRASSDGPYSTAAEVRSAASEVYASFGGTLEERNAGFVLKAHAHNFSMDECMESEGFPEWDWSLTRQYATPVDPLASGTWFAEPLRPVRSEVLMAQRSRLLASEEMNTDDIGKAEDAAITRCIDSTPPPSESAAQAATHPASARALIDDWHETIRKYAASVRDESDFRSCIDSSELDVLRSTGLTAEDLGQAISTIDPNNSAIPASASDAKARSSAWTSFLADEAEIVDADWKCRQDTYEEGILGLGLVIDQFAGTHADEIEKANQDWKIVVERAADVGYVGQSGSLDK